MMKNWSAIQMIAFVIIAYFVGSVALQAQPRATQHEEKALIENEIVSLAEGFAKAFAELSDSIVYIEIKTRTGSKYLSGVVRSIKASRGVLTIRMSKGTVHLVSARDIALITTEDPKR